MHFQCHLLRYFFCLKMTLLRAAFALGTSPWQAVSTARHCSSTWLIASAPASTFPASLQRACEES